MALRVLLADNSETIKKVIQLTLQDYAAEVRSVNSGVDVLEVARAFKPDIIFADILLQKRNGYEICGDLKGTRDLAMIPVVLMWSGFMDLDKVKTQQVRADATLEKPFDSNDLRELVQRFVPKATEQQLSQFMDLPSFAKQDVKLEPPVAIQAIAPTAEIPAAVIAQPAASPVAAPTADPNWNMESFADINEFEVHDSKTQALPDFQPPPDISEDGSDDFAQVPINQVSKSLPEPPAKITPNALKTTEAAAMSSKSSSNNPFELDVPDETDFDGVTVSIIMPIEEVTGTDFLLHADPNKPGGPTPTGHGPAPTAAAPATPAPAVQTTPPPITQTAKPVPVASQPAPAPKAAAPSPKPQNQHQMSEGELETLLRNQSQEVIEKIVWKLIPDMAERIIREEIQRLLEEPGTNP